MATIVHCRCCYCADLSDETRRIPFRQFGDFSGVMPLFAANLVPLRRPGTDGSTFVRAMPGTRLQLFETCRDVSVHRQGSPISTISRDKEQFQLRNTKQWSAVSIISVQYNQYAKHKASSDRRHRQLEVCAAVWSQSGDAGVASSSHRSNTHGGTWDESQGPNQP